MSDDRARRVFLVVRRALLMICAAIEKEFGAESDQPARMVK